MDPTHPTGPHKQASQYFRNEGSCKKTTNSVILHILTPEKQTDFKNKTN